MDRRQRKTRKAIFDAFEDLMASEHYSAVTVAQIIDRADIGRSTFYAHFETKDDLLSEMCREMFDHIFEGVNEYCVTHPNLATESLAGKLAHLLYHLRDTHSGVCGKLIREGEPIFTRYFEGQLDVLFAKSAPAPAAADMPADLQRVLFVSSFSHTVSWWFATGAAASPEQVANWYVQGMGIG
jgi:AcrR family transcriptional regulator